MRRQGEKGRKTRVSSDIYLNIYLPDDGKAGKKKKEGKGRIMFAGPPISERGSKRNRNQIRFFVRRPVLRGKKEKEGRRKKERKRGKLHGALRY